MASNSKVDDVNVVNGQKEQVIQALKENPASAIALSKMLSCDGCKGFARPPIRYCGQIHKICSVCHSNYEYDMDWDMDCPAKGCKEKLLLKTHDIEAVRAMKLLLPCKNSKNGCPEKGNDKEIEDHEFECEFRFVDSNVLGGEMILFKNLSIIIDEAMKKSDGKWKFESSKRSCKLAFRDFVGPDGRRFRVILDAYDDTFIKAYAYIIGGKTVANRYRVEMRLTSSDKEFTLTHHGPVFPVDVEDPGDCEESYWIAKKRFAIFNGYDYFGACNKDKNGEVIIPMTVKIIKKELNIPKEDSCFGVDMEVEEK